MKEAEGGEEVALPGIVPEGDALPAKQLECDGELFEVRPDLSVGTSYTWASGSNPGCGFSVSRPPTALSSTRGTFEDFSR